MAQDDTSEDISGDVDEEQSRKPEEGEEEKEKIDKEGSTPKAHSAERVAQDRPDDRANQSEQIQAALLAGSTREELVEAGFNKNSVRTIASQLKTKGRWPVKKPPSGLVKVDEPPLRTMQPYTKGSPPEALIQNITIPIDGSETFEAGMKFGMTAIVLGVRISQELAAAGIQQVKPLIELSRESRRGEAEAAKSSASAAAEEVGERLIGAMGPVIEDMSARIDALGEEKKTAVQSPSGDMAQFRKAYVEPLMNQMMKTLLPGVFGSQDQGNTPSGWTRTTKK